MAVDAGTYVDKQAAQNVVYQYSLVVVDWQSGELCLPKTPSALIFLHLADFSKVGIKSPKQRMVMKRVTAGEPVFFTEWPYFSPARASAIFST